MDFLIETRNFTAYLCLDNEILPSKVVECHRGLEA